jgi:hypothetical protein
LMELFVYLTVPENPAMQMQAPAAPVIPAPVQGMPVQPPETAVAEYVTMPENPEAHVQAPSEPVTPVVPVHAIAAHTITQSGMSTAMAQTRTDTTYQCR